MKHYHYQRTQHRFVSINSPNGRCTEKVRHTRGVVRCGLLPSDPCHRYYPCRKECAGVDFPSCESRDRHEANVHGNGW
jgi:hypothetical protein